MFLYWTVIGKRKEIIQSAGTRTQNLFHLSGGGGKWHITGPRPLSFRAAALRYRGKTQGRLCCTRQVTAYTCEQRGCHWWLRLPTRNGSFLIPGTDSRYVSTCTSQERMCFMSSYPPRQSFRFCHCCHLLWTGGIRQLYSAWNKFQLPQYYSRLNSDCIVAHKNLPIPLFRIFPLYAASFLTAVRDTKVGLRPWTFPKQPISNKSDTLLSERMSK